MPTDAVRFVFNLHPSLNYCTLLVATDNTVLAHRSQNKNILTHYPRMTFHFRISVTLMNQVGLYHKYNDLDSDGRPGNRA